MMDAGNIKLIRFAKTTPFLGIWRRPCSQRFNCCPMVQFSTLLLGSRNCDWEEKTRQICRV